MNEQEIKEFWETHSCGDHLVGGLEAAFSNEYETFFREYDGFRYRHEGHILECLNKIDFTGKTVLEVGLGQGADSEQIIRRGARWSGIDLTWEFVARVRTRLALRHLDYENICQGSVLNIPFADDLFDIVISHGVLHHVPEVRRAQEEIARVLKPDGELIIMLYARWSFNYYVAIAAVRRFQLLALYGLGMRPSGFYGEHLDNLRKQGMWRYLRMKNFVHSNTDGPHNPYSKVYSLRQVQVDFPAFHITRAYKRYMHGPPLPVSAFPFGRLMGWHLWVHLKPLKSV